MSDKSIASLSNEAHADAADNKASDAESKFEIVAGESPTTDNRGVVAVARNKNTKALCAVMIPKRGREQSIGLSYVTDLGFVHIDADDATLKAAGLQRIPATKTTAAKS